MINGLLFRQKYIFFKYHIYIHFITPECVILPDKIFGWRGCVNLYLYIFFDPIFFLADNVCFGNPLSVLERFHDFQGKKL